MNQISVQTMARQPTISEKKNQASQLCIGLTHVETFRPNLEGLEGPNVTSVIRLLKSKIENLLGEEFSLDEELVKTTVDLIGLENDFTNNLTGEVGGNYASTVVSIFEQHLKWLNEFYR